MTETEQWQDSDSERDEAETDIEDIDIVKKTFFKCTIYKFPKTFLTNLPVKLITVKEECPQRGNIDVGVVIHLGDVLEGGSVLVVVVGRLPLLPRPRQGDNVLLTQHFLTTATWRKKRIFKIF